MASEDVATFLQHYFTANPVVARDFALLHNKYAVSLDLKELIDTISFSLRLEPPRARSSTATKKLEVPLQSPLRHSIGDDNDSESNFSPKTRKSLRGKSTPAKEVKPRWHEALSSFTKERFESESKAPLSHSETVPFKILSDL